MRNRELPGWASSLVAARETWPRIDEDVWRRVAELEAPASKHFIGSQNELYFDACSNNWVTFPKR